MSAMARPMRTAPPVTSAVLPRISMDRALLRSAASPAPRVAGSSALPAWLTGIISQRAPQGYGARLAGRVAGIRRGRLVAVASAILAGEATIEVVTTMRTINH